MSHGLMRVSPSVFNRTDILMIFWTVSIILLNYFQMVFLNLKLILINNRNKASNIISYTCATIYL